ncbi:glycosyltransferase family 9 protein [Candidatus Magnetominusculus xianensis]|uniref:Lipopolysaccharide core heptosyltransferase n=1 Tax=Candidatus Magnetominusculus xianensis TaxID=1748249 RepID=A0ABR5SDM8_9BACT|nr:glycosyltransferase family 9 protein [Candidatus Magnetominusculus xianensis]KWT78414.1 lipopolysaccharide core heptosyltransferase [Candidatus Magnetominusculus xianensis]MBF0403159.1 glycosyltransferase family 9 protein [Nitrospirota bacterium]
MKYKIINKKKLIATAAGDMLGSLLHTPLNLFRRKKAIDPALVNTILVIRTAYIGDAIMTLPILKPLSEGFPNAKITFLTSHGAASVLETNPYIHDIIAYDPVWFYAPASGSKRKSYFEFMRELKTRTFDLVIEARADIREILMLVKPLRARYKVSYGVGGGGFLLTHVVPYGGLKHKVEYHLDIARYLGCPVEDIQWGIYLTKEEKANTRKLLRDNNIKSPFVAVHPGVRIPLKKWLLKRYAALYDRIETGLGIRTVITASEKDADYVKDILKLMRTRPVDLTGKLTLRELAGVLSESQIFVCNDSAPMHIAASMDVPVVALFGPSKSIETAPFGNPHRVVEKDFQCRYKCDESTCKHEHFHACMEAIEVEDVIAAIKDLLKEIDV